MSFTFTLSGAAIAKAGVHANVSGALLDRWSDDAEGMIEARTGTNWTTTYASLSTGIKGCLSDVASSAIAMNIISYDTTGYLTREADTLMNRNDDIVNQGIATLSKQENHVLKTP